MDPIAIIGFSFKMPQGAIDEDSLWDVLQNRRNLMTEWPENRLFVDGFHDEGSRKPNTIIGRGGCFMAEDPRGFDAPFFSIMPKEAAAMDPQQRWLLEVSYHAFENAGLPMEAVKNSRMAVFEASMSDDYVRMHAKDPERTPQQAMTGNADCTRPNRVSWHFGLLGPSIHVDTACSGSLVAMDLACQSIRNGDADSALVLGCNLMLGPEVTFGLGNQGFLSPSSVCHSFDHRADGYGRGEGFVAMIVKPLADAIRDGNMIRAVIRGTGSNSDGHTPSMTMPSADAQERLMRHVYSKAGLDYNSTRYFEAHGTGTPAGDPIEMKAIGRVFRTSRSNDDPLYVGSIKANVGHLEGGAGLAGLIKAVFVLEKGIIPPQALFEKLNPDIDADFFNTRIPTESTRWPSTGVRRASVNSFGMGGANSHIVLDDAFSYMESHGLQGNHQSSMIMETSDVIQLSRSPSPDTSQSHGTSPSSVSDDLDGGDKKYNEQHLLFNSAKKLLVWSAGDENGITRVAEGLQSYYNTKVAGSQHMVDRLAYTLANQRTHLSWRSFAIVDSSDHGGSLVPAMKPIRASINPPGIAYVFTGQGAQYIDMGLELIQYPVFKRTLDQIDGVLQDIGCKWDILDELRNKDNINSPEYTQPLCTALQIALSELLKEFGVKPVAVVGHSSGEIAAAYATGALSLESAVKIAYYRGQAGSKLRDIMSYPFSPIPTGAMMSVNLSNEEVQRYLEEVSAPGGPGESIRAGGGIHVACINSPINCTLSGAETSIDILKGLLDAQGIFAQKFHTGGMAYHSPTMRIIALEYLEKLKTFLSEDEFFIDHSDVFMSSSVTGKQVSGAELVNAQYWVDNLVSPVRFVHAVSNLMSEETKVEIGHITASGPVEISHFIEVGPHSALRRPILDTIKSLEVVGEAKGYKKRKVETAYASVLIRNKSPVETMLQLLGQLFSNGCLVSVFGGNKQCSISPNSSHAPSPLVDLPCYPFDHSHKYWEEPRVSVEHRLRRGIKQTKDGSSALLGKPVMDRNPLEPRWRNFLNTEDLPWIGDHIIGGTNLLAGTCMIAMAVEAAWQNFNNSDSKTNHKLDGFVINEAKFLNVIVVGQSVAEGIETHLQMRPLHQSEHGKSSWQHEATIFTCSSDGRWTKCFRCIVQLRFMENPNGEVDKGLERQLEEKRVADTYENAAKVCNKPIEAAKFYEYLRKEADTLYRDAFSVLQDIHWDGALSSTARINLLSSTRSQHQFPRHPIAGVLDAAAHLGCVARSSGMTQLQNTAVLSGMSDSFISVNMFTDPSLPGAASVAQLVTDVWKASGVGQKLSKFSSCGIDEHGSVLFSLGEVDMAVVAASAESTSGSRHDKTTIFGIDWKPQLSLMSSESLKNYMENVSIHRENEEVMKAFWPKIETLLIIVARKILTDGSFVAEEYNHLPEYFKRQLAAISHYYLHGDSSYAPTQAAKPLTEEEFETLLKECEEDKPNWKYFSEVARNLESILRGETDALATLFNSGLADQFYASFFEANYTPQFHAFLELASHENRDLKVLEVGAGTGGMTRQALSVWKQFEENYGGSSFSEYTYTDISPSFFVHAKQEFQEFEDRMLFKTLDLEKGSHDEEGFEAEAYDVILASSVLHATSDLQRTLRGLRKLLKPKGYLVFLEIVSPECACGNIGFGIHPGWWLSAEEWRKHSPLINESQWDQVLRDVGFSGNHLNLRDYESDVCHYSSIIVTKKVPTEEEQHVACPRTLSQSILALPASSVSSPKNRKLAIIIDSMSNLQHTISQTLCMHAVNQARVFSWGEEEADLLAAISDPDMVVVSLLESGQPFLTGMSETDFRQLKEVISRLKNLLWVATPHTETAKAPFFNAMKGFLRVMRAEYMDKYLVTLEIESTPNINDYSSYISTVLRESFNTFPSEVEYIVKDGLLGTWKIIEDPVVDSKVKHLIHPVVRNGPWKEQQALELCVETPGVLDSLRFVEDVSYQTDFKPDDVEIEAKAWPLSFRDLLIALGRMDYMTPGFECAGIVTRMGSAVNNNLPEGSTPLMPGDRVIMSMCRLGGTMRTYPRGPRAGVYKIPTSVSFEAAISSLNPAMTAYYSLANLARLQEGEKVLIHSAAGSTGQMALWIAKMLGAEIFATVGHDAKKTLLIEEFGIPGDHIFYSRDTTFAQGIKRMTNGEGVDVVLNSLSGEALRASWACLAPFGRFVEIGKADIMSNASLPMLQFAGNTTFFGVDLFHVAVHNAKLYQNILKSTIDLLDLGLIQNPRPLHYYPISNIESAFRFMQSGKNTGRIIIQADEDAVVPKRVRDIDTWKFNPDASYLIIGGLGGIGRAIMAWMADKGAKNIITFSRSGLRPESSATYAAVSALRNRGVRVHAAACDASSAESLSNALKECARKMPQIKGCINAAMDIYDKPFEGMSHEQWQRSLKSKVSTSWNLHQQLPIGSVDFFILLSSLVGIFGPIAQSNYAAGCTVQDSIAQKRAAEGENAVSIDLGWMRSIGRVAEQEEYQRNRQQQNDMRQVETEELLAILSIYCQPSNGQRRQVLLGALTPADFLLEGKDPIPLLQRPMFTAFARTSAAVAGASQTDAGEDPAFLFKQASKPEDRVGIVVQAAMARLARALGVPTDDIEPSKLLSDYGVDSLMAVELRNWIGKEFKANIPVFDITNGITILALGGLVCKRSEV